ncbi:hypothetical protein BDF19DRAFT_411296 [Syncephalis fuscata]|nr:hypothetical protein BDF19DRAFT_411296 [Syncephalis fuscata]
MSLSTSNERLWKNLDVLLYLCNFMDDKTLTLFAMSCQFIYQIVTGRSYIWKQRYFQTFCLSDRREQEWLSWFIWCTDTIAKSRVATLRINKKRKRLLLSAVTTVTNSDSEPTSLASDSSLIPGLLPSNGAMPINVANRPVTI